MARIETDPNYSSPTFSRATAGTDIFKKEDVQSVAAALSTHDHSTGKGLVVSVAGLAAGSIAGSAIADGTITSAKIADGTIDTVDLKDGSVTSAKIADLTIANGDIADGTITTAKIGAQQISAATIALGAVGQAQLADGAVTTAKIGAQQVQNANIQPSAVNTPQLAVGAATASWSAVGSTANPTTTSATMVDMPDMLVNIATVGGDVLISLMATLSLNTVNALAQMQLNVDGTDVGPIAQASAAVANSTVCLSVRYRVSGLSVAGHPIKGRWSTTAGTMTASWSYRSLVAEELRR
jgi:hypothetical protein